MRRGRTLTSILLDAKRWAPDPRAVVQQRVRDPLCLTPRLLRRTIAECVREGDPIVAMPRLALDAEPGFVSVVICSIDDAKHDRAVALYRKLLARVPHGIISIRNARSLAEAYNWAVRNSVADVIVLSHDDVDVLADDFAARLLDHLRSFDALGVVAARAPRGRPWLERASHLRGWITHHSRTMRVAGRPSRSSSRRRRHTRARRCAWPRGERC